MINFKFQVPDFKMDPRSKIQDPESKGSPATSNFKHQTSNNLPFKPSNSQTSNHPGLSLYIHIPFCRSLCPFCHFYRVPDIPPWEVYLAAIRKELDAFCPVEAGAVRTCYVGGGTPTVFPAPFFRELRNTLDERFDLSSLEESTVETDGYPGVDDLASLRMAGFDRVSVGVKSFIERSRELLGIGPWSGGDPAESARAAGFRSVGVDLVYGMKGQSPVDLKRDLECLNLAGPDHVSLYSLEDGESALGDHDLVSGMFRESRRSLAAAGYRQYEITNFARAGHQSRHNTAYWLDGDYIGVGPSAHSSITRGGIRERWRNLPDVRRYLTDPLSCRETVSREGGVERAREALILALRMRKGVQRGPFLRRYGHDPAALLGPHLRELKAAGLLRFSAERIRLTTRGMLLSNEVFVRII
jgi:oxygen-independent coproporphyrinogen-3 oxidase